MLRNGSLKFITGQIDGKHEYTYLPTLSQLVKIQALEYYLDVTLLLFMTLPIFLSLYHCYNLLVRRNTLK